MTAPARPRSVPLAIRKADVRELHEAVAEHKRECHDCRIHPTSRRRVLCDAAGELAADLREAQHDVKHWFDPGPADVPLFGIEAVS